MRVVISVRFLTFPPLPPALPVPCPEVATLGDSFDKRHRCEGQCPPHITCHPQGAQLSQSLVTGG